MSLAYYQGRLTEQNGDKYLEKPKEPGRRDSQAKFLKSIGEEDDSQYINKVQNVNGSDDNELREKVVNLGKEWKSLTKTVENL